MVLCAGHIFMDNNNSIQTINGFFSHLGDKLPINMISGCGMKVRFESDAMVLT